MTARNPRHVVRESYRNGAILYDVTRRSWEHEDTIVIRSFLTRREADRWVADIESRHDELVRAVTRGA